MNTFIDIAYKAYCEEGDQFDCRSCDMYCYLKDYLKMPFNSTSCREQLLFEVAKEGKHLQELLKREYFGKCKHCKHLKNCQIDSGHYNTINCYQWNGKFE